MRQILQIKAVQEKHDHNVANQNAEQIGKVVGQHPDQIRRILGKAVVDVIDQARKNTDYRRNQCSLENIET